MKNQKQKTRNKNERQAQKQISSSTPKGDRFFTIFIFIFSFLLYTNTLGHGYVLDDDVVYLKNKDVQAGFGGIKSILSHSFIYGFTGHNDQSYRPLVLIVYAVEKELFGNNPHMGHFINVLLFALSCLLLFHLMKRLLAFSRLSPLASHFPLLVALLFASHPIHTEAVANIKGRDDILNFIFLVLALFFVLKYIDEKTKRYLLLSIIFFFCSLLCKEMAVTFLALIPLAVFFFRSMPTKKIVMLFIPFAAASVVYMFIRSSVLETVTFAEKMKVVNNALAAATNESDRIATAIYILGKYILLLFYPHPLSWDYSYNQIPIVSFLDIKVLLTLLVFAFLGGYALLTLKKKRVFSFCILFFFITMSVVSNIFIMIGATLGERFLFTPSLAFCMAVAAAPLLLSQKRREKYFPIPLWKGCQPDRIVLAGGWALYFVVLVSYSYKTFSRNNDWKNSFSLFLSGVEASPNSSRAQSAIGSAYREMAEKERDAAKRIQYFQQATEYYKKAIEILPENTEALYNAGVSYYGTGDKEAALKMYETVLSISPEHTNAANNAGVIFFERQKYDVAKKYFLQAIKYGPSNADAFGNLGAAEHNTGNIKEAIEYYKKSLQINPNNQNVQSNLAKAEASVNKQ